MKKVIATLLAVSALLVSVSSQAQDKWILNHLGLGVSAGLDGVGADIVVPLTPYIQFRGGYNTLPKEYVSYDVTTMNVNMSKAKGDVWDIDNKDVTLTATANLDAAHLFMDLYLGKKSNLHLTVGAYYAINPAAGGPYRIGTKEPLPIDKEDWASVGIELKHEDGTSDYITTDNNGYLNFDYNLANPMGESIGMPQLYPYAGIGLGRNLSKKMITLTLDLGVIYTGGINIKGYNYMYYDENKADLGIRETIIHSSDLGALKGISDGEYDDMIDMVQGYYSQVETIPFTPVIKFNLVFSLF